MARETQPNPFKTTIVVLGALAAGWAAIELALKPWLDGARAAIDKSDPTVDPDGDEETTSTSTSTAAAQTLLAEVADAAAEAEDSGGESS